MEAIKVLVQEYITVSSLLFRLSIEARNEFDNTDFKHITFGGANRTLVRPEVFLRDYTPSLEYDLEKLVGILDSLPPNCMIDMEN